MQTTHTSFISNATVLRLSQWLMGLFTDRLVANADLEQRVDHIHALLHMARDLELSQPNLAAELRYFATRS
jgi:hypothetical protein